MKHIKTAMEEYYKGDQDLIQGEYKKYRENGMLRSHCFYVDGLYHGELKSYRENGELYIRCFYLDDRRHGEYKVYHDNGKLYVHCFYEGGKRHGESKTYGISGRLVRHRFFVNDKNVTDEVEPLVSNVLNITSEEKLILKLTLGLDL